MTGTRDAYSAFTACVCTWTCAYTCWRIAAGPNACVCVGHHVAAVCVLLLALTREKNVHAWPVRFTCAHTKLECKEAQSHRVPPSRSTRSSWLEITGPRGPQGGRERIARFNCGIEISRWTRFIYAASGSRAQLSYSQLASQKSKVVAQFPSSSSSFLFVPFDGELMAESCMYAAPSF